MHFRDQSTQFLRVCHGQESRWEGKLPPTATGVLRPASQRLQSNELGQYVALVAAELILQFRAIQALLALRSV